LEVTMQVGIGLPGTIPGVKGALILDWAKLAEVGPFSSLSVLDWLVYPNYEPLITLAAVAGVTQRKRLVTTVLVAPLRNTAILAKQVASIDALSNGRLTLGVGIGGREDDFLAAQVPFHERGKRFDEQLATMKRIWSGQPLSEKVGAIGPAPVQQGGPELLIGGYSPEAIKRISRWGNGFISAGSSDPDAARQGYSVAEQAWKDAGRPGKPRFVACYNYGLGPNAAEKAAQYIRHYDAFTGPMADRLASSVPSTTEAVKGTIQAFSNVGVDELILWPTIPDLNQVELLARIIA
jgi:alkanesulfonate monooxygenase SsuD/methylene tetrahydromethanopterin reductase-like flavin-dependent oxidoreductase (luciferase family)